MTAQDGTEVAALAARQKEGMQLSTIRHELDGGILTVTLDRADQLNAFTVGMADELERTFIEVNDEDDHAPAVVKTVAAELCGQFTGPA